MIGWLVVTALAGGTGFPPDPMVAMLGLLPVDLVSLWLVARMLRAQGSSIRDLLAHEPGTWRRETAWALLWVMVLFVPFIAGIMGRTWVLHGVDVFVAFETMLYDPDAATTMSAGLMLVLGTVALVTFAPLNTPTEELLYRGYAQSQLLRVRSTPVTVLARVRAPARVLRAHPERGGGVRRRVHAVGHRIRADRAAAAPARAHPPVVVPVLMVAGVVDVAG